MILLTFSDIHKKQKQLKLTNKTYLISLIIIKIITICIQNFNFFFYTENESKNIKN